MRRTLQAFEYDVIRVGENGLTGSHFDALVKFNQRHKDQFFTVRHQALRVGNYVGVLQVGNLTIEVLPKADRSGAADKTRWRNALIDMLRYCGYLEAQLPTWAALHLQTTSLLDLYLEAFLSEVEEITRHGLTKCYRRESTNLAVLKGRIAFNEHITRNLVHKERFFTDHDRYDRDNRFNQILKKAVIITADVAAMGFLRSRAKFLSDAFEPVSDIVVTDATFDRLRYDRKTERYRRAIALARLIILNYQPDVRAGGENVLAIMCDMNELFELYVFRHLRRAGSRRSDVTVRGQDSYLFWRSTSASRHIRPDIEVHASGQEGPLVLDTKWKVPRESYPADPDLKQMYAYSARLHSTKTYLLYPRTDERPDIAGVFTTSGDKGAACSMMFVDLFEGDGLRRNLGDEILKRLAV